MNTVWNFDNTYQNLSPGFYSAVKPVPVKKPQLILLNRRLAKDLGLDFSKMSREQLDSLFTGNKLPAEAEPIAQAYAGHQFGHFTMLGDGRAIVLGEHITPDGKRFDIQFKGSGQTPYSRSGDGRATLYSMLREYLISESLFYLGVPASGSLAVAETGEPVYRETIHRGSVLTRVASSHIRIGTFEYARHFLPLNDFEDFLDYVISRHYPQLGDTENKALRLLEIVSEKLLELVLEWMRIGFIHGVLNTDNMSICGEAIDFGPCAFMNTFNPAAVFSSVDTYGRYAFGNQPGIIQWNLSVFAGTLLPFIHSDQEKAIEAAQKTIEEFKPRFEKRWYRMMGKKLGFKKTGEPEKKITDRLLAWMQKSKADYTNTFLIIPDPSGIPEHFPQNQELLSWIQDWQSLIDKEHGGIDEARRLMTKNNPLFIPRNHLVEKALTEASENGDYFSFNTLLERQHHPYRDNWTASELDNVPPGFDENYKTFCGT